MRHTNCSGCGTKTRYLVVRFCSTCLHDMVRSMKGERY
jgi:hypothetical protein